MKKVLKRTLAIVLTLVMLLSAVPVYSFAATDQTISTQGDELKIQPTNSFGKVFAENFDTNVINKSADYYVSDVIISGNSAEVEMGNKEACTLVVAIYDENTEQMLDSAVETVEGETEKTTVKFNSALPKYFIVKAFLLNDMNAALCSSYYNYHYTSKFEQFNKKTVDDFDSSRVVNLDEDKTTNFFVLDNGIKKINSTSKVNTVITNDDDNNKYVIGNIDNSVRSLKKGDTFFLKNGNDIILVKIDSIKIDGSTATFTSTAVDSEDVFDYVKIESEADTGDFGIDESTLGEGMHYVENYTPENLFQTNSVNTMSTNGADTYTLSDTYTFFVGKLADGKPDKTGWYDKISGSLTLTISGKASYYEDEDADYKEASLTIEISLAVNLEVKATLSYQQQICRLAWSVIPGCCWVGIAPTFVISGTFKGTLKGTVTAGWGATYNSDRNDAWQSGIKKPNFKPELKYELDIFVGIDLKPYLKVISKHLLIFELDSTAGFHITAKYTPLNTSSETKIHQCKSCIDGEIKFDFTLSFSVTLGKDTALEQKLSTGDLFKNTDIHLADFYYSEDFDEFAFTKCPHCYYKVVIGVRSEKDNSVISNANLTLNGGYTYDKTTKTFSKITGTVSTDENGDFTAYYNAGKYDIYADATGYESTSAKTLKVDDAIPKEIIKLKEAKLFPVTFTVTDELTGETLSGINVTVINGFVENDIKSTKTTTKTDSSGNVTLYYFYNTINRKATFSDNGSGYSSFTQKVDGSLIFDNHYDVKLSKCKKSNIKFIITDSETNEDISASVSLSGTDDNPYKSLGITELSTYAPFGSTSLDVPNGNYTLTITATGYESYSGSFTANRDGTVYYSLKKEKDDENEDSVFTGTEATGTIINFGSYPQSKVNDSVLINKLDDVTKNWQSYGYYTGTGDVEDGKMEPSDYMLYADFKYNGNKYRAVTFSQYRPFNTGYTSSASNSYQDDNGYYVDNVYYFKYEPLQWRVLNASEGLVMCNSAIDSQAYNNYILDSGSRDYGDSSKTYYASDYGNSSIRDWLNEDFYNTAFSSTQQSRIKGNQTIDAKSIRSSSYDGTTTYDNNCFLLSYWDVINPAYDFSSSSSAYDTARQLKSTDYAQCQGCYKNTSTSYRGNSWWRLRSPYSSYDAANVGNDGDANYVGFVNSTCNVIVPALKLKKSTIVKSFAPKPNVSSIEKAGTGTDEVRVGYSACKAGGEYILLNVLNYGENFKLTTDNLLYIDQLTADKNGNITTTFIPKYKDETSTILLIGDFGNGIEAKELKEIKTYVAKLMVDGKLYKEIEYNEGQKSISLPPVPEKEGYTGEWESYSLINGGTTINAIYTPVEKGKVNSVSINNLTLNYKASATIKPDIKADDGVEYTVEYKTSNAKIATVDKNGNVYAAKKGTATITCTVTDEYGNEVSDTCTVNVKYAWWQWLIKIVLFGWIWY